jgi:hypothetical protein
LGCVTLVCVVITVVAIPITVLMSWGDLGPGIGYPPEQHMITIKEGMTKDEVRSVLGEPHRIGADGGDDWTYRCDRAGGTLFRVRFGLDERVTERFWWLE